VATGGLLGEHELAVDLDLEDAAVAGNQRPRLDRLRELAQQRLRQTDGSRKVVSGGAVRDRDVHIGLRGRQR
jgi:hypothetical protein